MAGEDEGDLRDLVRSAQRRGAGSLLIWGLISAGAFTAAFASWQYGPGPTRTAALAEAGLTTGSVAAKPAAPPRPPTAATPELVQLQRDVSDLRGEIGEIKRILARLEVTDDQATRRLDSLEDQALVLTRKITEMATVPPKAAAIPAPAAPVAQASAPPPPVANQTVVMSTPRPEPVVPTAVPEQKPAPKVQAEAAPVRVPETPAKPAAAPPPPVETPPAPAETARAEPVKEAKPALSLTLKPTLPGPSPAAAPQASVAAAKSAPQAQPPAAPVAPVAAAAPPPAPLPKTAMAALPGGDQTGAIPPKPAAESSPSRTEFGVDLGGFRTLDQLRAAWNAASLKHANLTKSLQPLGQMRETPDGVEARLVAGPFANALDAAKFCAQVKALGTNCAPSIFVGQSVQTR